MNNIIRWKITAMDSVSMKRVHIFTVTGDPDLGIARAKREAKERNLSGYFSDYAAIMVTDDSENQ